MSTHTKPKKVVHSRNLQDYKIPKAILAKLDKAMEARNYMVAGGKTPPPFLRLYNADFFSIDDAVRAQSEKKFSASTVVYKTLPLLQQDAKPQDFALAS